MSVLRRRTCRFCGCKFLVQSAPVCAAAGDGRSCAPVAMGFGAMSPEKRLEISRKGGVIAHERGVAHEFTTDEARAAGRKGGRATNAKRASAKQAA